MATLYAGINLGLTALRKIVKWTFDTGWIDACVARSLKGNTCYGPWVGGPSAACGIGITLNFRKIPKTTDGIEGQARSNISVVARCARCHLGCKQDYLLNHDNGYFVAVVGGSSKPPNI